MTLKKKTSVASKKIEISKEFSAFCSKIYAKVLIFIRNNLSRSK